MTENPKSVSHTVLRVVDSEPSGDHVRVEPGGGVVLVYVPVNQAPA